ncbi:MAG: lysoplasmalogenase [bacterium]|nr:lysoplasmalogenase [bacterium]
MLALVAALKPLPALALALLAWRGEAPRLLAVGLVFAALGDALLLGRGDTWFLAGMLAFAAMHLCYIAAFARAGHPLPWKAKGFVGAYVAALVGNLVLLVPHAGPMRLPLVVYSALLVAMASMSLRVGLLAGIGGALFMASDTLLAFAKFAPAFPLAPSLAQALVLVTYYAAQLLIVTGMLRAKPTAS